jgi:predicted nuclease of predicted toxin-antitoxin system
MKLLLDQNLSFKLIPLLLSAFPGSKHVKNFSLTQEQDVPIWSFAAENGFTIVSKDSDFLHLALLRGHPPKVVYLRLGNCSTEAVASRLLAEEQTIKDFMNNPEESVLDIE